jgi:cell wall-associated NlpC family hydrolase
MTASRSKPVTVPGRIAVLLLLVVASVGILTASTSAPASADTVGGRIVASAASESGTPYCDGGGGIDGPSNGGVVESGCGAGVKGFDCMSLVQYAVYQATGIALPGDGSQPKGVGTVIEPSATIAQDTAQLLPGDAVYWGGSGLVGFAHSGVYAGDGYVWDAIGVDQPVQRHTMAYLATIYSYDGAVRYWDPTIDASGPLATPVVGVASTPHGDGYWLTDSAGDVDALGSAVEYGSLTGRLLNAPIIHIVATPDGRGYWLVSGDGGIFTFGDARFFGSMGASHLNAPVVAMAPTPSTGGYWLAGGDGGIFSFDAPFFGAG